MVEMKRESLDLTTETGKSNFKRQWKFNKFKTGFWILVIQDTWRGFAKS
jgi:hypothetical protein